MRVCLFFVNFGLWAAEIFAMKRLGSWAVAFFASAFTDFSLEVGKNFFGNFFGFLNRGAGRKNHIPQNAAHYRTERYALLTREFFSRGILKNRASVKKREKNPASAKNKIEKKKPRPQKNKKKKKLLSGKKLVGFVLYKSFDFVAAHAFHARSRDCRREIFPVAFCQHSRVEHADYSAVARGAD